MRAMAGMSKTISAMTGIPKLVRAMAGKLKTISTVTDCPV
jgi:hypothetical protein